VTFSDDPVFREVDLTGLMDHGVLMAANERFFWPLGLALTWDFDRETGVASGLHVREWVYADGHHESIELSPDDEVGAQRREAFAAWASERIASLPEGPERSSLVRLLERVKAEGIGGPDDAPTGDAA
jgi:hypothetical protein